jgi:hypothetical protein
MLIKRVNYFSVLYQINHKRLYDLKNYLLPAANWIQNHDIFKLSIAIHSYYYFIILIRQFQSIIYLFF